MGEQTSPPSCAYALQSARHVATADGLARTAYYVKTWRHTQNHTYITHCCRRKNDPRSQLTCKCIKHFEKFEHVAFEICDQTGIQTDKQTDRHTYTLFAILRYHSYRRRSRPKYHVTLSPVHTSNNVEATLPNTTSRKTLSTKSNVASTLLPFDNNFEQDFREISSFRQSRNKLNMFRRNFTKNSFDIVAKNGNNVEATFDFVERIVRLVALDNVVSTLPLRKCCCYVLLVWTGL